MAFRYSNICYSDPKWSPNPDSVHTVHICVACCMEGRNANKVRLYRVLNRDQGVNKNNLLSGQFLIFCLKNPKKIINWVGSFQFLSALTQLLHFP